MLHHKHCRRGHDRKRCPQSSREPLPLRQVERLAVGERPLTLCQGIDPLPVLSIPLSLLVAHDPTLVLGSLANLVSVKHYDFTACVHARNHIQALKDQFDHMCGRVRWNRACGDNNRRQLFQRASSRPRFPAPTWPSFSSTSSSCNSIDFIPQPRHGIEHDCSTSNGEEAQEHREEEAAAAQRHSHVLVHHTARVLPYTYSF
mmetsp:Transcript_36943/g.87286  ORF Transcript_36943/g.87286 Transcript_36943/m.87286 type:complete len:202 (-) Transcript_36943:46-651(-)